MIYPPDDWISQRRSSAFLIEIDSSKLLIISDPIFEINAFCDSIRGKGFAAYLGGHALEGDTLFPMIS